MCTNSLSFWGGSQVHQFAGDAFNKSVSAPALISAGQKWRALERNFVRLRTVGQTAERAAVNEYGARMSRLIAETDG